MRNKISISLDKGLMKRIDAAVDGNTIRNRSQAIEYLIKRGLEKKDITKALILSGGKLENLKVRGTFKPLVKIDGKEVVIHTIDVLKSHGINEVIIAAGPITDHIFSVLGDGSDLGIKVIYLKDNNLGTAGVVNAAKRYFDSDFFVVSADVYFDFDLHKMISFHSTHDGFVTLAVSTTELQESKDYIELEGSVVKKFDYVPKIRTYLVNAGIYIFRPEIFSYLPERGSLEKDVFPTLAGMKKIVAYNFAGKWRAVN